MERKGSDLLKTIGAIIVIGGIVVATFLYGNKQRQDQVRRDQQIRQQQEQKAAKDSGPKVSVDNSKDKTAVKPETATANAPTASTSSTPVSGSTAPVDTTPKTGGELFYLLPAGLMLGLYKISRSGRNRLRRAFLKS